MRIPQHLVGIGDGFGGVAGWFHVVCAVHDQQVRECEETNESVFSFFIEHAGKLFEIISRQIGTIAITVSQICHQHA